MQVTPRDIRPNHLKLRTEAYRFGAVKFINPPKDQLRGAVGEHIRAAIPADVTEGVELICDFGYRSSQDCSVL